MDEPFLEDRPSLLEFFDDLEIFFPDEGARDLFRTFVVRGGLTPFDDRRC